ncbi:hypothetical protein B0H17DRAFT_1332047 [Mycena rosella]|uniref:Uncharacterized protein n=1 Tax=Mycena rosella TaxID=1033263 RepID=A0AAD7DD77_MYCRO|nr:hypothetical protein B0H17DRAFT_1332047 [Mycena rosella]
MHVPTSSRAPTPAATNLPTRTCPTPTPRAAATHDAATPRPHDHDTTADRVRYRDRAPPPPPPPRLPDGGARLHARSSHPALRRRIKFAAAPHDADTAAGHPASSIDVCCVAMMATSSPTHVPPRAREGMRTPAMHRAPMPSGWCDSARQPRRAPRFCYAHRATRCYADTGRTARHGATDDEARRLRWQCADDGPRAAQDVHLMLRQTHGAWTGANTACARTRTTERGRAKECARLRGTPGEKVAARNAKEEAPPPDSDAYSDAGDTETI